MSDTIVQQATDRARTFGGEVFAEIVKPHAENTAKNLANLRKFAVNGAAKKERHIVRTILNSYSAKVVAVVLTAKVGTSVDQILSRADALNNFVATPEPIVGWADAKNPGVKPKKIKTNFRPIFDFGPHRRAVQKIVDLILREKFDITEACYLTKGLGAEMAASKVEQLHKKGFGYVVVADITNCFGSVQTAGLGKVLGLPQSVVNNHLRVPPYAEVFTPPSQHSIGVFGGEARRGLPQGSLVSGMVVCILLGPLLEHIAPVDQIILYGDDILIAANSLSEAKTAEKALCDALAHHSFGPFHLKHCGVYNFQKGFDFLQYRYRKSFLKTGLHLRPSTRSYARVIDRTRNRFQKDGYEGAVVYLSKWVKAFRKWKAGFISRLTLSLKLYEVTGEYFDLGEE